MQEFQRMGRWEWQQKHHLLLLPQILLLLTEDFPVEDIYTLVKDMQDGLHALKGQASMRTFTAEIVGPSNQSDLDRMAVAAAQRHYDD